MVCKSCGRENAEGAKFCIFCGSELVAEKPEPELTTKRLPSPSVPFPEKKKRGKRKLLFVIASVLVLLLLVLFVASYLLRPRTTSAAQKEILDTLGAPAQFIVAYLPQGDGESAGLARTEIWFYPDHQKKVAFVSGKIAYIEDFEPEVANASYPNLSPGDFDYFMGYQGVTRKLGEEAELIDIIPELIEEEKVETYMTDDVVFAIERGHLVYIQTLGGEED